MRALLLVLLLAACATAPIPQPDIVRTVEVRVPVGIPCKVVLPPVPLWELDRTSPDAPLFDLVKAAAIELKQRAAYEILLLAAAVSCAE